MIRIKIKTDGAKLTVLQPVVTSGSGGSVFVDFEFDGEWNGLDKTAVFSGGGKTYLVLVNDCRCEFPSELLSVSGNVKIGVFGTDGTRTLTSLFCNVKVSHGASCDGDTAENYTPSLHEQLFAKINGITAVAKGGELPEAKIVDSGGALVLHLTLPKGEPGKDGEDGKDGVDGKDGYTPVKGVDYCTPEDEQAFFDKWYWWGDKSQPRFGSIVSFSTEEELEAWKDTVWEDDIYGGTGNIIVFVGGVPKYYFDVLNGDFLPFVTGADEKIGDIESVLDEIIALKNGYIGGAK